MKNTSKPSFHQHLFVSFLTVRFSVRNLIFFKHRMKSLDLSFIYLINLLRSKTTFQDCSNNWPSESWARSGDAQSSKMASSFGLILLHWTKSCTIQFSESTLMKPDLNIYLSVYLSMYAKCLTNKSPVLSSAMCNIDTECSWKQEITDFKLILTVIRQTLLYWISTKLSDTWKNINQGNTKWT